MVDRTPSFDGNLPQRPRRPLPLTESAVARSALIAVALVFLLLFLLLPLIVVFAEALRMGLGSYWATITEPEALTAIRLTLLTALIVVPLNAIFGIAAAWAITKFLGRCLRQRQSASLPPFTISTCELSAIVVDASSFRSS